MPEGPVEWGHATIADRSCRGGLAIIADLGDGTVLTYPMSDLCGGTVNYPTHTYNLEEGTQIEVVTTGKGNAFSAPLVAIHHVTIVEGDSFVVQSVTVSACAGQEFTGIVASFQNTTWPDHGVSDFTATIDWGDGSPVQTVAPSAGSGPGIIEISGTHTFTDDPSSLAISTTLHDRPPGTGSAQATASIDSGQCSS